MAFRISKGKGVKLRAVNHSPWMLEVSSAVGVPLVVEECLWHDGDSGTTRDLILARGRAETVEGAVASRAVRKGCLPRVLDVQVPVSCL